MSISTGIQSRQPCPELIELVLQNYEQEASGEILDLQHLAIASPWMLWLGTILLCAVPIYLFWGISMVERWRNLR
jgi:hypothetical protein